MKKYLLALALFCAIQINQNDAYSIELSPTTISYQGVLTDGDDAVLADGTHSVTFTLYDAMSNGDIQWTETQTVTTTNGLFNVDLGSIEGITGVDFSKQLYLEVMVESTTLSPRIKFTAQPYAFMAKRVYNGTINNATIGADEPSTGAFTDLSSTNDAVLNGVVVGKGSGAVATNTALGNNTLSANTTGANQVAVGQNALATNTTGGGNTAIGRNSMNLNTTGSENTAIGRNSLNKNTTANGNSAIGYYTLRENTTGQFNTAVGTYSEQFNTTGNNNASLGYQALYNNTTGSGNTAVGFTASSSNTTGEYNTSVGIAALEKNTTGNRNTALGHQALYGDGGSTGSENTAVGSSALYKNTTGTGNIAIGYQAGFGTNEENEQSKTDNYATFIGYQASRATETNEGTSLSNVTAIGKNARVRTDNSMVLGGFGEDAINVGIGTDSPIAKLDIVQDALADGLSINQNTNGSALVIQQNGDVPGLQLNLLNAGANAEAENIGMNIYMDPSTNTTDANMRGIVISNNSLGDNSVGAEFYMNGGGTEEKGIYIDLTSGYDFDEEDSRIGAAIGVDNGIGLMAANTTSSNTVKLATNDNALEVVGSTSINGTITIEGDGSGDALIQGAGDGALLIASAGDITLESTENITLNPTGNLVIPTDAGAGKVLTSDADGNATWQTASGGSTAVPTVLQGIFTNQNIVVDGDADATDEKTYTITGAKPGDGVIVNVEGTPAITNPWSSTNYYVVTSHVSANDTVKVRFSVPSAGAATFSNVKIVVTVIRPIQD